jgi:hypothetical protein
MFILFFIMIYGVSLKSHYLWYIMLESKKVIFWYFYDWKPYETQLIRGNQNGLF